MLNGRHMPAPDELVEMHDGQVMPVMFFYAVEGASFLEIANGTGFDVSFTSYDDIDANADGADDWQAAYDADPAKVLGEWQPTPPDGFAFGGKWHTEDGIQACFLRARPNIIMPMRPAGATPSTPPDFSDAESRN